MSFYLKNYSYLEALSETILIFDGAMGTNLQKLNLQPNDFGGEQFFGCNDILSLTHPEAVEHVHRSFLEVGVDVIETNTFRSNRITLSEFGLEDKVQKINQEAARLAKQTAQVFSTSTQPRFVAGSIGPSGKILSIDEAQPNKITFEMLVKVFKEQTLALLEGGVDLLLLETQQDLLEVKAAILGIRQACRESDIQVPLQVQVTMDIHNRMLFGSHIDAVAAILEPMDIDVIGLNCSTGPDEMEAPIEFLGENLHLPVSCLPNAGMPEMQGDAVVFPLSPQHFAARLTQFVEKNGLSVVGGCCGTSPEHLALLVNSVHGHLSPHRQQERKGFLSSPIHAHEWGNLEILFVLAACEEKDAHEHCLLTAQDVQVKSHSIHPPPRVHFSPRIVSGGLRSVEDLKEIQQHPLAFRACQHWAGRIQEDGDFPREIQWVLPFHQDQLNNSNRSHQYPLVPELLQLRQYDSQIAYGYGYPLSPVPAGVLGYHFRGRLGGFLK